MCAQISVKKKRISVNVQIHGQNVRISVYTARISVNVQIWMKNVRISVNNFRVSVKNLRTSGTNVRIGVNDVHVLISLMRSLHRTAFFYLKFHILQPTVLLTKIAMKMKLSINHW